MGNLVQDGELIIPIDGTHRDILQEVIEEAGEGQVEQDLQELVQKAIYESKYSQ